MKTTTFNLFNGNEFTIAEQENGITLSVGQTSWFLTPETVKELTKIFSEYINLRTEETLKKYERPVVDKPIPDKKESTDERH